MGNCKQMLSFQWQQTWLFTPQSEKWNEHEKNSIFCSLWFHILKKWQIIYPPANINFFHVAQTIISGTKKKILGLFLMSQLGAKCMATNRALNFFQEWAERLNNSTVCTVSFGAFGLFVVIVMLMAKKYSLEPTRGPYGNNQGRLLMSSEHNFHCKIQCRVSTDVASKKYMDLRKTRSLLAFRKELFLYCFALCE